MNITHHAQRTTHDAGRIPHDARRTTHDGFTLLETIFVVALLSLIILAFIPYFRTTVKSWEVTDRHFEILQNARVGMDDMVRKIRTADAFIKAKSDDLEIQDGEGNNIRFRKTGTILKRDNDALAEPVESLNFTYYDSEGNTTSEEDEVRMVKISMTISDAEGKVDPVSFSSYAVLRKDAAVSKLVINEINYNPPQSGAGERRNEWIELYNYGDSEIDLTGWTISDSVNTDNLQPGNGTMVVPAGGYAIITANDTEVYDNYDVETGAVRLQVDDNTIGNGLGDNGDTLTIADGDGNAVDSVSYEDSWGGDGDGDTIERIDETGGSSDPLNWEESSAHGDYTAGSENSTE